MDANKSEQERISQIAIEVRARGGRMTQVRRDIVKAFVKQTIPLTIVDVARQARADVSSTYRTITLLLSLNLLEEIPYPDGSRKFALSCVHHHHIICTRCGTTVHIPCRQHTIEIPQHAHFKSIDGHSLIHYGICVACA